MGNHVHLLAVPENENALARGIGLANQVYTQYRNRKRNQSGRIWQNRFFSCLVENDQYLWTVARHIERNPIKVGLVQNAEDYRWSSAAARLMSAKDDLLQEPSWLEDAAKVSYAEFLLNNDEEAENRLRSATRTGRPFGSDAFIDTMETLLHLTLRPRKPGRLRKYRKCP